MSRKVDVWITADSHYAHKAICLGVSPWEDKASCRDFDTLEEMNDTIVDNINAVVKPEDHLYHIGDWSFGHKQKNIVEFRERINCKHVWLFPGNHDHYLMSEDSDLRHLFVKVRLKGQKKINGQVIVFNHFPELVWNTHHYDAWMLHGHCHGSLSLDNKEPDVAKALDVLYHSRKTMDVGIDAHPEFRPFHFDEIEAHMVTREVKLIDHHTPKKRV